MPIEKISALPIKNKQGHEDVVEILERLLAKARNGEIEAVAVAHIGIDDEKYKVCRNEFATGYDDDGFILYTSIEIMRNRMMDWMRSDHHDSS